MRDVYMGVSIPHHMRGVSIFFNKMFIFKSGTETPLAK